MQMLDEVEIYIASGQGGNGAATFHREKFVPFGGPNGADGGDGGDIILVADRHLTTLFDFKSKKSWTAENGIDAAGQRNGKDGKDLEIRVPIGTIVTDLEENEILVDLNVDQMRYVICEGGRGGFGNVHFTNSIRQAPKFAQKGAPGEELRIKLELKLLADIGLVGLPNAGKSTLLSQISKAKPKIGDYPFTTITPNLGVAVAGDRSFVVADLPGLIEGASEGHGLGDRFLKHVERTKVIVHLVDAFPIDGTDPWENYQIIESELAQYSDQLADRARILVLNKMDLQSIGDIDEVRAKFSNVNAPIYEISGATSQGVNELLFAMAAKLDSPQEEAAVIAPVLRRHHDSAWDAVPVEDGFELTGRRLLRLVAMTNLDSADAVHYLHRRLQEIGVIDKLKALGAQDGDTIYIDSHEFEYTDWS